MQQKIVKAAILSESGGTCDCADGDRELAATTACFRSCLVLTLANLVRY